MASSPSGFKSPSWYWFALVGAGMTLNYVVGYNPSLIPYQYLGPLGSFLRFMAYDLNTVTRMIFTGACIIHVSEGLYALWLTRKMNASITDQSLWCLQTTLLGYPSLCLIQNKPRNLKN